MGKPVAKLYPYLPWCGEDSTCQFASLKPTNVGFPGGASRKELTCQCTRHETQVWSLDQEDALEEGMATHSSILAWRISWTEEPGRLQSMGLQGIRHDRSDSTQLTDAPSRALEVLHDSCCSYHPTMPAGISAGNICRTLNLSLHHFFFPVKFFLSSIGDCTHWTKVGLGERQLQPQMVWNNKIQNKI